MRCMIEIDMNNAAFEEPTCELARILRELADKIEQHIDLDDFQVVVFDVNGNKVGWFEIKEEGA